MSEPRGYFATLFQTFGQGWNRFWFTPSDPLPLAVLRIAVGTLALYVVMSYGFDLRRFFDPETGILRVETLQAFEQQEIVTYRFSYLDHVPGSMLPAVHYAGVAVMALFVVGFCTRISAVGALIVYLSYFHRGPMLTGIAEPVISFLLFYLCLGPCGKVLSVDAWLQRRSSNGREPEVVKTYAATVPLRLIQVHTSLMYFLMFCGKMQASFVWWNGTAVWWLIARPESALVDLRWLADYPYVINFWTLAIFAFEPIFAVLIWSPLARPLLLGVSAVLWVGTGLITGLVPFALAVFFAGLAFVPAATWHRALACCGVDVGGKIAERPTAATAA